MALGAEDDDGVVEIDVHFKEMGGDAAESLAEQGEVGEAAENGDADCAGEEAGESEDEEGVTGEQHGHER